MNKLDKQLAEEQAVERGTVQTAFVLAVPTLIIVVSMFLAPIFTH